MLKPRPRRPISGIGRVLFWPGGSVWIGRQAGLGLEHSHHAIQISLALTGSIRLHASAPDWEECRGAVLRPHRPHRFDGCGQTVANILVDPESLSGRALAGIFNESDVHRLPNLEATELCELMLNAFMAECPDASLVKASLQVIGILTKDQGTVAAVDDRIPIAVEAIRARLESRVTLAQIAETVNLSASRFRHLFREQTGMSFRAYVLWMRLERAITCGMTVGSWTEAAQQAGFADSAHLTRTCRAMLGVTPAMLISEQRR